MFKLLPTITKNWILDRITQEQVFEYYLGIKVQTKYMVKSPMRVDNNPTCKFNYSNGILYFNDFNGHFSGNAFDLVMFKYNTTFHKALEIIAQDFNLSSSTTVILPQKPITTKPIITKPIKPNTKTSIQIKKRSWCSLDLWYWNKMNITDKILNYYNVYPVKHIWIENRMTYSYNANNPAYAYYFGNQEFKIYFPKNRQYRFISNTTRIQGYKQLPKTDKLLIITKSLKDVMTFKSFGISSVALQNEVVFPSAKLVEELKRRFKTIYTLYDFDLTGIRTANKIKKTYNIIPLFLTNGRLGSFDYKAKDISDYCKINGIRQTKTLIDGNTNIIGYTAFSRNTV